MRHEITLVPAPVRLDRAAWERVPSIRPQCGHVPKYHTRGGWRRRAALSMRLVSPGKPAQGARNLHRWPNEITRAPRP